MSNLASDEIEKAKREYLEAVENDKQVLLEFDTLRKHKLPTVEDLSKIRESGAKSREARKKFISLIRAYKGVGNAKR